MGKRLLVDSDIEGGVSVIERINRKMPIDAAFWYRDPETGSWELILATSSVKSRGPMASYSLIYDIIAQSESDVGITFDDIRLVGPDSELVQHVNAVAGRRQRNTEFRYRSQDVAGAVLEDVYVYFT